MTKSKINIARGRKTLVFAINRSLVRQLLQMTLVDGIRLLPSKTERVVLLRLEIKSIIMLQADCGCANLCTLGKMVSTGQRNAVSRHHLPENDPREHRILPEALSDSTVCKREFG